MSNKKDSKEIIFEFIEKKLLLNKVIDEPLTMKTDLIRAGIIDSLMLVRLISFLEDHFEIEIDDWKVTPESFMSIEAIDQFVKEEVLQ